MTLSNLYALILLSILSTVPFFVRIKKKLEYVFKCINAVIYTCSSLVKELHVVHDDVCECSKFIHSTMLGSQFYFVILFFIGEGRG